MRSRACGVGHVGFACFERSALGRPTTCFCENVFHCLVKCYISIHILNLAVGAKCGFFACQTQNFTRTKPSQEPHTQSLVTLILLTLGQALNSVPTARFTHFVRKPASSTLSELVGGCAPKPLPSYLGYVSISINFLVTVFIKYLLNLYFSSLVFLFLLNLGTKSSY